MTAETAAKKDIQKLQRAIVDGLEDVKAQEIQVFNTEHLSPLFERVVVASGTSNRQTRALAASVVDAVRDAGFGKPRLEGEDNGEWIIVDCGAAVVHVMQPAIRQYYQLEDIWGEKPVRLRLGAPKPVAPAAGKAPAGKAAARPVSAGKGRGVARVRDAAPVMSGAQGAAKPPAKAAPKSVSAGAKAPARPAAKSSAPQRSGRAPAGAAVKAAARPAGTSAAKAPAKAARPAGGKSAAAPAAKPARKVPARKA